MSPVYHIVVSGRVQGVGFRFFTEQVAHRYGVAGWVRNLPSGEVEVLARVPGGEGSPFLAAIREGPRMATVTGFRLEPAGPGQDCPQAGFSVR